MRKVLFLTYDFPYPFNSGGKIRAYNMMKYANTGIELHVFSFTRGPVASRQINKLKDIGVASVQLFPRKKHNVRAKSSSILSKQSIFNYLYYSPEAEAKIMNTIRQKKIDILHAESFYTSYYINENVKKTGVKTVFGTENVEHRLYEQYVASSVSPVLKKLYEREVTKIKNEELQSARLADLTIAVNTEEADYFGSYSNQVSEVIENGIDLEYFSYRPRQKTDSLNLLFVGNFKYFPNIEAAQFLYKDVFKKVSLPHVQLTIIGKEAKKLKIPQTKNIQLIDYIEDIRDAYYDADLFIFPVTIGGGTNFKVLEAMATGLPIIGIPERISALGVKQNIHFFGADHGPAFVQQIEYLAQHEKKAVAVAEKARAYVEKHYGWQVIGKKLEKMWKKL